MAAVEPDLSDEDLIALLNGPDPSSRLQDELMDKNSATTGALGARAAQLHNTGRLDLLAFAADPSLAKRPGWQVIEFDAFLDGLVAELDLELDAMLDFIVAASKRQGEPRVPTEGFKAWCRSNPARWRNLAERTLSGQHPADPLVIAALRASDNLELIGRFIARGGELRNTALFALNSLSPHLLGDVLALLDALLGADDDLDARVLFAALWANDHAGGASQIQLEALLAKAAHTAPGPLVQLEVARIPTQFRKLLTPAVAKLVLEVLEQTDGTSPSAIDAMDWALSRLESEGFHEETLALVTRFLVASPEVPLERLDHYVRQLLTGGRSAPALIGWLLGGQPEICRGLTVLLVSNTPAGPILSVDAALAELSDDDLGFVCRKAVGYLHDRPLSAASILVAALRRAPPELATQIGNLLFDPILINFPGSVGRFLATVDQDDPAFATVADALARNAAYEKAYQSMGEIPELWPTEAARQVRARLDHDELREARKAGRKDSIADLFPTRVILHGNRVRSVVKDLSSGKPRVFETTMGEFGFTTEVARAQIADPVATQHLLFRLRVERRTP